MATSRAFRVYRNLPMHVSLRLGKAVIDRSFGRAVGEAGVRGRAFESFG